jgi:hypothetical protein
MNKSRYYDYISEKLIVLTVRIEQKGKLNILDLHVHSENFYRDFLNLLYGWNLENMNTKIQNVEAIDLIDKNEKLIIQVSATSTKQKVESALNKDIIKKHKGYIFKFISISKDAKNLRNSKFKNLYGITFNPYKDIIDIKSLLDEIFYYETIKMRKVYNFIKEELGNEIDMVRLDSDLVKIIKILSKEDLNNLDLKYNVNDYEIENKIEFNNLDITKEIIDEYKIYYTKLDKKYKEFDKQGANKSMAVLNAIRKNYFKVVAKRDKNKNADEKFLEVIEKVTEQVLESGNLENEITIEELDLCINILVVDAFIRCKIFKNPEGYNCAITR